MHGFTDKVEAISTNGDLFIVPVTGGSEPKHITTQPGFDGNPVYSPDGKYIAYHAQLTAAYEADKWRVMLYDRASGKTLYGRVPAGSVVVSGTLPSAEGRCSLYCAVIVKTVDAKTRAKTSLNELLRGD